MAICGSRSELKTDLNTGIKTTGIWLMDNGTKTDESNKFGAVLASSFLGRSLDDLGTKGGLRHHWLAENKRQT